MKIVTAVFDYDDCPFDYGQMYRVFTASCRKHMPDVEIITLKLDVPPANDDRKPGLWTNTCKLRAQVEYLEQADDDLVFVDCDMLCLRSFEDVWDQPFDIGYTVKPPEKKTRCRLNGGVVFVRNNERAHLWMRELLKANNLMYSMAGFHREWRKKYFGMNQSAMGYMIESHPEVAEAVPLSTHIWNAVDCDWSSVDNDTRLVHVKGKLRRCIFRRTGYDWMLPLVKEWYSYTEDKSFEVVEKMPWDFRPQRRGHSRVRGSRMRVRI